VKFTEQGRVTLHVAVEQAVGHPRIRFEVRDTGIGIDPQKPLFLPFEQADGSMARRFGGTGLGLAIVRELVNLMEGSLGAVRNPDVGSTFWFAVPLPAAENEPEICWDGLGGHHIQAADESERATEPRLAAAPRRAPAPPVLPADAPRILVVDDNVINRELACAMLEELGVACDLAASGPDALLALAARSYPLVLMDLQMPGMDGLATCRALRAQERRHTPIVGLSALAMPQDRQRALDEGMDGYLTKPYSLSELSAAIAPWVRTAAMGRPPSVEPPRSSRIEALRQLSAGDDFLTDIVRLFVTELPGRRRAVQEAFALGDLREIREAVHALRSGALALGVMPLCNVCLSIEDLARAGELQSARGLLPAFELACDGALRTLATLLPSTPG
jgi:CheY-like chemotaxis protein/HPt (histidine-containing phosphotransfer) domain-containing protein